MQLEQGAPSAAALSLSVTPIDRRAAAGLRALLPIGKPPRHQATV